MFCGRWFLFWVAAVAAEWIGMVGHGIGCVLVDRRRQRGNRRETTLPSGNNFSNKNLTKPTNLPPLSSP